MLHVLREDRDSWADSDAWRIYTFSNCKVVAVRAHDLRYWVGTTMDPAYMYKTVQWIDINLERLFPDTEAERAFIDQMMEDG